MLKKASGIIIWSAVKAAGAAVIPVTVIRVPLLTKITANMATNVITAYGYGSLSGLSNFFSLRWELQVACESPMRFSRESRELGQQLRVFLLPGFTSLRVLYWS